MADYSYIYPSTAESVTRLLDDLETDLAKCQVGQKLARGVTLAVSEAFTNALVHGNKWDPDKKIKVLLRVDKSSISADITDEGRGGVEKIRARTPATPLDESGRGIDLIRHFASTMEFSEIDTGGLRVTLTFPRSETVGACNS